jgi:hypothetical protein
MTAFTHVNAECSRFSNGGYGVDYAAFERDTAALETAHHRAMFLRRTNEAPCIVEMRCYLADIAADLHDLRGATRQPPRPRQKCGKPAPPPRELRAAGGDGLDYDSVRHSDGRCVALCYPDLVAPTGQGPHFYCHWEDREIAHISVTGDIIVPNRI